LKHAEIASIWKGGCIIRAKLLDSIREAFKSNPQIANLMLDPNLAGVLNLASESLRGTVRAAYELGTPCLAYATCLGYFDSYRQQRLPANMLQALRDCFGAHTYHRTDKPGTFHTDWAKP
jgi:6-phosphogluconate dehydrogenase